MKKLLTIAFTLLLGATLSFAQATGGSTDKPAESGKKTTSTKSGKKSHTHKGGKKKKNSGDANTSTTNPK